MIEVDGAARREGVRIAIPGLLGLVACTPIYDAQFNDRAGELEEFRTDFRTEEDDTSLIASGGNRIFWVATKRPEDQTFLHSMVPGDAGSELVYQWSMNDNDFEDFHFGEEFIARCSFSTARALRVNDPAQAEPGFDPKKNAGTCAVEGNTVWLVANDGAPDDSKNALYKWLPPTAILDTDRGLFSMEAAGIVAQISTFGVSGNVMVAAEVDGDLYTVDIAAKRATFLNNENKVNGVLVSDERGALYETSAGPRYVEFDGTANPPDRSFDDMVADGGYHLSFKHGDVQQPAGNGEYVIHGRHIIYRGQRGIFAYGLDTHNVVDLLLDRGEGIDLELAYHQPAITSGGQLFVFGTDSFGIGLRGPVYQVDLKDRLK